MSPKTGPKPKTISDTMLEVDLSPLRGYGKTGDPSMDDTMRTLNRGLAMDMIGDYRERMSLNRTQRKFEEEKIQKERERLLTGGAQPGMFDPSAEFMKGLANPEWLRMWREMTPQERQELMMQIQQMGMLSRSGVAGMGGMMPYMMYGQMAGSRGETLSVKDLAAMFSTGIETATKAMTSAQQSNQQLSPVSLIGEIAKLTEPYKAMADEAGRRQYELMLRQIEKGTAGGGMDKALENIQRTLDVFGGGTTSTADIEIAKIQSDSQYQMMNLQMQMNLEAERLRADGSKWEQAGGIIMSGLAGLTPLVAKGLGQLGEQTGRRSRLPPGPEEGPRPPSEPYAVIRCNECGKDFQVRLLNDAPPPSVKCPHCTTILERGSDQS